MSSSLALPASHMHELSVSPPSEGAWQPAGRYIPLHKRYPSSTSSIGSESSSTPSLISSTGLRIYTRDVLLALARSPLAHAPLANQQELSAAFPLIMKDQLSPDALAKASDGRRSRSKRQRRPRGSRGHSNNSSGSKRESSSEGSDRSWREHLN